MGSGINIKRAIQKYGIENFKKEILFECSSADEMARKEAEIVTPEFLKREDVYNLAKGGYLGWIKAHEELSPENFKEWGKIGGKKYKERYINDPELRKKVLENFQSPESKKKRALHPGTFSGKHHSEETKTKMGNIAKTHTGERNSSFGTCWIYNEKESKKIKKDKLQKYLDLGWQKGRIMFNLSKEAKEKMAKPIKGSFWITNGITSRPWFDKNNIPEGWRKGKRNGKKE